MLENHLQPTGCCRLWSFQLSLLRLAGVKLITIHERCKFCSKFLLASHGALPGGFLLDRPSEKCRPKGQLHLSHCVHPFGLCAAIRPCSHPVDGRRGLKKAHSLTQVAEQRAAQMWLALTGETLSQCWPAKRLTAGLLIYKYAATCSH